jgi:RNA 2',3'-cyclic 3'-phosphodiesterase
MSSAGTVGRDDTLRLFLALRVPDDVRIALAAWAGEELSGGRLVAADKLHVTLAFLGARPARDLAPAVDALREGCAGARPIRLGVGAWHEARSVGWLELDDTTGAAAALASDLHDRLERLDVYRRESRPWLPHLTMLRYRKRPRLAPSLPDVRTFVPSDAAAYLSRLHPSGARYEVLESVPLEHTRTERAVGRSTR